ncbi:MAG: 50S ribosomal protein L24 [Candidatus ainarchaeum sp.]|nr:50S ribosomal protein L24 [Candidatus ainarchaeum sp.]
MKGVKNRKINVMKRHMKAHLSKELREKMKKRSGRVKKGDKVKVLRGKHKGIEGKIAKVNYKSNKVYIEGVSKRSARGRDMPASIEPSNIMIISLIEKKTEKKGE